MKRFLKQAGLILLMMVLGTIIDYFVHSSRAAFYVEPEYFRNKIIFGAVWGLLSFFVLRDWLHIRNPKQLAWGVPALIALFLQTKYFYQGRDNFFVFLFLVLHFLMFLPFSYWIFIRFQKIFLPTTTISTASQRFRWIVFIIGFLVAQILFFIYFTYIIPGYHRFG